MLDQYHGLGVARLLMTALFLDCYCEGLLQLRIDILRSNSKATGLIRAIGAEPCTMEGSVAQYSLNIETAISALRKMAHPLGISDIMAAFTTS